MLGEVIKCRSCWRPVSEFCIEACMGPETAELFLDIKNFLLRVMLGSNLLQKAFCDSGMEGTHVYRSLFNIE